MDIKLIASDLDGTLMATDHVTVTERTKKALKAAQEKGAKIAICTGRALAVTESVKKQIPFIDYVIFSNGSGVYDCKTDKIIYEATIDEMRASRLISFFDEHNAYYNVYHKGNMYVRSDADDSRFYKTGVSSVFIDELKSKMNTVDNMQEKFKGKTAEVIITYFISQQTRDQLIELIESLGELEYVSSIMDNIEIVSAHSGKGAAIAALCKELGCTSENAMTFGDASNDCSMLEFAKYSFAMANGDEKCKASAKYSAPSNAEDGVAQIIEKYVL